MHPEFIYNRIKELKEVIGELLHKDPDRILQYKTRVKTLENNLAKEKDRMGGAYQSHIEKYNTSRVRKQEKTAEELVLLNQNLTTLMKALFSYAEETLVNEKGYYELLIRRASADLVILKELVRKTTALPSLARQAELCRLEFAKVASTTSDRYSFKPYFISKENEYENKVARETSGYYSSWMIPIKKTWYRNVFLKGLAKTDIAGKNCFVTDVTPAELPPGALEDFEKGKVDLYYARLAYVKFTRKLKKEQTSWMFEPIGCYPVIEQTLEEFLENNPGWEEKYKNRVVKVVSYQDFAKNYAPHYQAFRHHLLNACGPDTAVIIRHAPRGSARERVLYMDWKSGVGGHLEDRYIATWKDNRMSAPKVATGTTPLRALSVLRNRISKDVTHKLGVI